MKIVDDGRFAYERVINPEMIDGRRLYSSVRLIMTHNELAPDWGNLARVADFLAADILKAIDIGCTGNLDYPT